MDNKEADRYIRGRLEPLLQGKGIDTRHNFRCLNPNHTDNNPSMSIDRNSRSGEHCKCFSCGAYYSTYDIIGIDYGLTDFKDQFKKACEIFNVQVDGYSYSYKTTAKQDFFSEYQKQVKNEQITQSELHNTTYTTQYTIDDIQNEVRIDFTDIVKKAHRELLGRDSHRVVDQRQDVGTDRTLQGAAGTDGLPARSQT